MNPDPLSRNPRPPRHRSRARLTAVATVALLAALAPSLIGRAADATEPCPSPQGAPAEPGGATAQACPEPPPPTTAPPGQPSSWAAPLSTYDDDPTIAPVRGGVTADRVWITPGGDPAGQVTGSGPLLHGQSVQFDAQVPPTGSTLALRLREAGKNGSLCRTVPGPQPTSGHWLRILTTGTTTVDAEDLSEAMPFANGAYPLPYGAVATVTSTTLTGFGTDGAHLHMTGRIDIPTTDPGTGGSYHLDLTYDVALAIGADNGTSTTTDLGAPTLNALVASTPTPGTLAVTWRPGPQPSNPDFVRAIVVHLAEPHLRAPIGPRLTRFVNIGALAPADQQWFLGQGFTLSMRNATMTPAGIVLEPALCRLDTT